MKKRLFATLLVAMLMPFVMQADPTYHHVAVDTVTACGQFTWTVNQQNFSTPGVTDASYVHGDTLYMVHVTIYPTYYTPSDTVDVDGGCTYTWGHLTLSTNGFYRDTLHSIYGCDSVAAINLTVTTSATKSYTVTACAKYEWHDSVYTTSTVISNKTFPNPSTNCDSILSLDLTIITPTTKNTDTFVNACESTFFRFSNGFPSRILSFNRDTTINTDTYTREGDAFWSGLHKRGATAEQCYDSIRTAHISIHRKSYTPMNYTRCDEFTFEGYYETYRYTYDIDTASGDTISTTIDTTTHNYSRTYLSNKNNDTIRIGYTKFSCDSMAVLNVTIHRSPVVSITGNINLAPGGSTTLYAVCDQTNIAYLWSTGATSDSINTPAISENTDYSVQATNRTTTCSNTAYVTVMANESITSAENTSVNIYPNPASAKLNIECADAISHLAVYDAVGQRLVSTYNQGRQHTLDLSDFANGCYIVRIQLRNGDVVVRNFIVTK